VIGGFDMISRNATSVLMCNEVNKTISLKVCSVGTADRIDLWSKQLRWLQMP
jgi:DNA-binding transcriptional regulator/RsmH inhibitor MraZ